MIKQVTVAVAMTLALAPMAQPAAQTFAQNSVLTQNVSDLWWNPAESGWGVQLNQMGNTVFATLYLYNQSGQPVWYTAQLTGQGNGVYTGTVYSTTGPYFGAATFDANQVTRTAVGTITITMQTNGTAVVVYVVNGVTVTKTIQRQTLVNADLTGTFQAQSTVTASNCTNSANNGTTNGTSTFTIIDVGGANRQITWTNPNGGACTYTGSQSQNGQFAAFDGATYSCSNGETGTLNFSNLSSNNGMFGGSIGGGTNSNGCTYSGAFSGLNTQTFGR